MNQTTIDNHFFKTKYEEDFDQIVHEDISVNLFKSKGENEAEAKLLKFIVSKNTLSEYISEVIEPSEIPDLIGKSVIASKNQFPQLFHWTQIISKILNIDPPAVYIFECYEYEIDSEGLNYPRIEISARLVRDFNTNELIHCLAKELVHIRLKHLKNELLVESVHETVPMLSSGPIPTFGADKIYIKTLDVIAFKWFKKAIFSAENFATALVGSVRDSVISTLLQVFNNREVAEGIDITSFCNQRGQIEILDHTAAIYSRMNEVAPYASYRIANILNFATSDRGIELRKKLMKFKRER